jgi:hypothetical protein
MRIHGQQRTGVEVLELNQADFVACEDLGIDRCVVVVPLPFVLTASFEGFSFPLNTTPFTFSFLLSQK